MEQEVVRGACHTVMHSCIVGHAVAAAISLAVSDQERAYAALVNLYCILVCLAMVPCPED